MARRYGAQIPRILEIVDVIGPCSTGEVYAFSTAMPRPNVEKYCTRAVSRGWMTVDRGGKLKQWTVVPGWREMVGDYNSVQDETPKALRSAATACPEFQRPAEVHHLQAIWQSL